MFSMEDLFQRSIPLRGVNGFVQRRLTWLAMTKNNNKKDRVLKGGATRSQVAVIKNSFPCLMMMGIMMLQSKLTLGSPKCTQSSAEIRGYTLIRSLLFFSHYFVI